MLIDGITAANDLGLTDAVPAHIVVHTDARLKHFELGNLVIDFRKTAPSKLYWAGWPAMRVVQALHWLQDVLPQDGERIRARLRAVFDDPDHAPPSSRISVAGPHAPGMDAGLFARPAGCSGYAIPGWRAPPS